MSRIIKTIGALDRTPPLTPGGLTATVVGATQINLACAVTTDPQGSVTESASGVAAYRFYGGTSAALLSLLVSGTARTYAHDGLTPETTYYYAVTAVDVAGNESARSDVVSATTEAATQPNRAPVWTDVPITITAYPGDSVSRQFTQGRVAGATDVWDLDGDTLEFSERATGVLALLGLSISPTGLLSGTIPSDADPQSLTARIGADDGQFVAVKEIGIVVASTADADADWEARALAPGVFWATNFRDVVRGVPGCTAINGQVGRAHDRSVISSIEDLPTGVDPIIPLQLYDYGDGWGWLRLGTDPESEISGQRLQMRRHRRWWNGQPGCDWLSPERNYAPLDYVGIDAGTGVVNERRGIVGTVGEGATFPFVETWIDGTARPTQNSDAKPCVREFYMQVQLYFGDSLYRRSRHSSMQRFPILNYSDSLKLIFINGGQSGSQVAARMLFQSVMGTMFYSGSTPTPGWKNWLSVAGTSHEFETGLDLGTPAVTSTSPLEQAIQRYGPSGRAMFRGTFTREGGITPVIDRDWIPPTHPNATGDWATDNSLAAPWRGYQYEGFSGALPYEGFTWSDVTSAGLFRPNTWHVFEALVSVQVRQPVNASVLVPSQVDPVGPVFVAFWMAPRGEPLQNIGYLGMPHTGNLSRRGPGHYGFDWNPDSKNCTFKYQDANDETMSCTGFVLVGAAEGFAEPTTTTFYALRAISPGKLQPTDVAPFLGDAKSFNPGSVDDFGAGAVVNFASGVLYNTAYWPDNPALDGDRTVRNFGGQYVVTRTEYTGQQTTVVNPWPGATGTVTGPVHKFTVETMHAAPSAGDRLVFVAVTDVNAPQSMREVSYGELIFSMEPIPAPGHLGTPLPMPWRS